MIFFRSYIRYGLAGFVFGWLGVAATIMQWIQVPNWVFFAFILIAFASVAAFLLGLNRYAKCPACGKFPRTRDNRVALNVDCCSHCGEQLKEKPEQ
jgi:hypothetical protein